MPPANVIKIEITAAKIGRSMKNFAMEIHSCYASQSDAIISLFAGSVVHAGDFGCFDSRLDLLSWSHTLQTFYNDLIACLKS